MFLAVFFVSKNGEKRDRKFLNKAKTIFIVSLKKGRKRMNKKHSKLITLLLVVAMLFTMTPMSAFATEKTAPAAEKTVADSAAPAADSTKEKAASVDVYLSVSDDAQYIDGAGGVPALQKLTVPYFDLALYGLEKFYFSSEDYSSGTLGEGTAETAKDKVTMLHLILYATEIYYCGLGPEEAGKGYLYDEGMLGTDDLTITGSPGSLYMQKFWGMDENLNYYLNYKYPEASKGWGSTADQILLRENDVVTIGHFTSWNFWTDPDNVFNYIKCGDKTVTATATQGEKVNMSAWIAGPGGDFTSTAHRKLTSSPEVYYTAADKLDSGEVTSWTSIGNANAEGDFVVDTSKMAPGEYIIAIPGQYGRDNPDYICSTPGAIRLTVKAPVETVIYQGKDWPFANYYYVEQLKLKGAEVEYVNGTDVYLKHTTAKDAKISFEVKAGGSQSGNLGINWNDDKTNTKTYSTNLVNGEATVKVYAYKASGAGASRSGTKTFKIHIAEPNEYPVLAEGYKEEPDAQVVAGEKYSLDLNKVFTDADNDKLTYTVSVDGAKAVAANSDYSYVNKVPGTYKLKFTATDGKTSEEKQPVHTVTLSVVNSSETYDVSAEVPEGISPKFYAVNEVKGGAVVKGEELKFEKGTVKVPKNITRIMWEADGVIGFSAPVESGAKLKLVKVSFAATTDTAERAASTAKVEITDKTGVKATGTGEDTYLLPVAEGFTYKLTTSEAGYRVVELKDQKPAEGAVKVQFEKKHFTVVAPKGSVVSAGTLAGSFKYSFAEVISKKNDGDTVVYEFAPLSGNAFVRVQRPDDKDAVTYWDWKSSKADGKTVTITKEQLFMNDSGADKFDSNTVYRNFEKYSLDLADIYMNINNEGYVNLNKGETKGLNMFRNWQAIESFMNSKISLPDFSYEIINIEGDNVVSIKSDANNSAAATLTAENEGTAIVLVTYDAMYSDSTAGNAGGAAGGGNRLSAIWPDRTGVFVVSVGKDGTAIKSNMKCNGEVFDAEHSPQFYTGDKGASVSFKPEEGVEVTVNRSTVGKETLSFGEFTKDGVKVAKDGTVTVSGLKTGRHIIRLEKDGVASYQVVTAQKTEVKYFDAAGKDMGDNPVFTPGEKFTIKIKGLTNPAEKFATKYNFNAQVSYKDEKGNAYKNSSGTAYGKYDFSSQEQVIEVTVPADWKEDKITLNGAIQMGGFAGDGIGGHRKVTYGKDSGMAHGTPPGMVLGTLPELVIYNKAHKHEFVKEVEDDKYFAAEADFNNGTAYYKSCSCGKAGTEKFYVGKGYGDEVRGKAFLEIRTYKNFDDYKSAQQDELRNIILNAKVALKAAKSEEEVNKIVTDTKAEMDKVKTSKQLDDELDAAKLAGKKAVAKYKKLSDYKSEQQAEISSIIEEAFAKINAATTPEEIDKIVADAQAKLDKVKTGAQVDAEFAAYKEKAKNEVKNYKNLADYRGAEKKALEKIIDDASSAITVAPTKEIVDEAVTYAKSEMDKVKTAAQLDKEEAEALAAAKVEAKKIVRNYKDPADYRDAQKAELEAIIKAADAAIDVAPNQYAVGKAVQTAKNSMDELKTAAQLDKEEADALAAAKEAAKEELAKYKNPADYRDAQKAELEDAIKAANEAIDAAETPEEVAKTLDEAKASLDKIKTAAQLDKEEADAAKPGTDKDNKKDNGVKTGDETAVALLFALLGVASTAACTLRRKYNK